MTPARSPRFPLFDSLRAIAALSIFVFHTAWHLNLLSQNVISHYLRQLNIGVAIFFVISGFLLYRPFVQAAFEEGPAPEPKPYAIRRALRIVPAYWVALPIVAVMLGITSEVFTPPSHILVYFGFLQIYQADTVIGGIGPAWTLCIEVTFYVAIPIWAWALRRARVRGQAARLRLELWALAGLVVFSIVWKEAMLHLLSPDQPGYLAAQVSLPAFADHFAMGMAVAVLSVAWAARPQEPAAARLIDRSPWIPWAAGLAGFAILGIGPGVAGQGWEGQTILRHELKGLIGVAVILPAVFGVLGRGWVRRLLAHRVLLWLGLVSYALYLWQLGFILKFKEWFLASWGWLPVALLAFAATVAVSALSWKFVEAPAQRLARRLTRGSSPRPSPGDLATADEAITPAPGPVSR